MYDNPMVFLVILVAILLVLPSVLVGMIKQRRYHQGKSRADFWEIE